MKNIFLLFALLTLSVTLTSHTTPPCADTSIKSVSVWSEHANAYCYVVQGATWYDFRFKAVNSNNWQQVNTMKCQYCTGCYLAPLIPLTQYEVQAKTSCSGWSASKTFTTP